LFCSRWQIVSLRRTLGSVRHKWEREAEAGRRFADGFHLTDEIPLVFDSAHLLRDSNFVSIPCGFPKVQVDFMVVDRLLGNDLQRKGVGR
jgi:hypothetical protein